MFGKPLLIQDNRIRKKLPQSPNLRAAVQLYNCADGVIARRKGNPFLQCLLERRARERVRREPPRRLIQPLPKQIKGFLAEAQFTADPLEVRPQPPPAVRGPKFLPS